MGEHGLLQSDGQIEVGVESVVLHPQFSSITSDYDVALLLLAAPGGDWALWDRVSHSSEFTINTEPVFPVFQVGTICLPSSDVYQVESKETLLVTLSNFPQCITACPGGLGPQLH